jgi:hypothetical protein
MHTLKDWKARRAGGRITVNGVDNATGQPVKIVGVDVITPGQGKVGPTFKARPFATAVDKHGTEHTLII